MFDRCDQRLIIHYLTSDCINSTARRRSELVDKLIVSQCNLCNGWPVACGRFVGPHLRALAVLINFYKPLRKLSYIR